MSRGVMERSDIDASVVFSVKKKKKPNIQSLFLKGLYIVMITIFPEFLRSLKQHTKTLVT